MLYIIPAAIGDVYIRLTINVKIEIVWVVCFLSKGVLNFP